MSYSAVGLKIEKKINVIVGAILIIYKIGKKKIITDSFF